MGPFTPFSLANTATWLGPKRPRLCWLFTMALTSEEDGMKKTCGPIHLLRPWMKRHGWMETAHWTWWHPAAQWRLGPREAVWHADRHARTWLLRNSQEELAHALRDAWQASWDQWRKKAAPCRAWNLLGHSWQKVAASFEATRRMLNEINPALSHFLPSHAMAVVCGRADSEASWAWGCEQF